MLAPWKKSYDKPRQCNKKQRTKEPLDDNERGGEKVGLKLNIQKLRS